MYCPKCGTENPDNAQICCSCSCVLASVSATTPAQYAKTSRLAIASLVLAVLSPFTCMLSAIPAIVLGIVSLVKINKSQGQLKGNGLAIAGLAVPFAVLPIIGILMGILMPALAEAREQARKTVCAKNMSALSKAMLIYASDYGEQYPTSSEWCDLLIEHNKESKKVFGCPGAYEGTCNYAMNKNAEVLGIVSPPDMVLLFETKPGWNQFGGSEILSTENHRGVGCNIVFVDGHVEFVKKEGLNGLKWTSE